MVSRVTTAFSRHRYILAVVAIALSTALFMPGRDTFAKGQWALLYLLVILLVASAAGTGPGIVAAVLSFFAWNFFFLPPYHTLAIHDPKDWLSLVAFLVVGVLVGIQAGRMREREARALAREQEAAALNRLSAAVVSQTSTEQMAESCLREVVAVLGAESATLFLLEDGDLHSYCQAPADGCADASVAARARRAVDAEKAGVDGPDGSDLASGTVAAAGDGGLYEPVRSPSGVSGVLTVRARSDGRAYTPGDTRLVTSLSNLVGAFLEREKLQAAATTAAAEREADRLKSSLLSSVSHELKTPLAALTATVSNLLESDVALGRAERARRTARHRRRRGAPEQQHRRPARTLPPGVRMRGSRGASSTNSATSWPPASTPCRRTCASACAWTCPTSRRSSTSTSCR